MPDDQQNPIVPIAVGFYLIALPLFVAVFVNESPVGQVSNLVASAIFLSLGVLIHGRGR